MSEVMVDYLERMDAQREALFQALAGVSKERLWQRPRPRAWSAGEQLDHSRVLNRCFRRLMQVAWPFLRPWAKLRRARAYETEIDDVYQRPSMPMWVGDLWPPYYKPSRPISVAGLRAVLALEHGRIRRFYEGKDEALLGNAYVWDPAIGRINLIQVLRVGMYHDQHHYAIVERMLLDS